MSGQYMIAIRPVIHAHVIGTADESVGWDWWSVLLPHESVFDWETDGLVAEPGKRCVGYVESKNDACVKAAIVVMAVTTYKEGHFGRFHLCGSHLARHRNGRPVRLAV